MGNDREGTSPEEISFEMILRTFLTESEENFFQMEECLVRLENNPDDDEVLQKIFRMAHTLKGNASSVGFEQVADAAHAMEDLLHRFRSRTVSVNEKRITLLLRGIDALRRILAEEASGSGTISPEPLLVIRDLAAAVSDGEGEKPAGAVAEDRRVDEGGRREGDLEAGSDRTKSLRVGIEKLDRILNLIGEMTIAQGRLGQLLEGKGAAGPARSEEAADAYLETGRLLTDLRETVMKVRMVPVGSVLRRHIRTVRDLARRQTKVIHLVIEGEEIELDTTVIELLKDPLVHLIRNAVDHGIESPERRKEVGKKPNGRIVLRAFHEAGGIVIQIEDDGSGFNRKRIIEKAISRGMISEGTSLSDDAICRLVFEPGFSTAESISDLSGRGVGMDVVQRNIASLRGTISIASREGEGTTITLRLPLTLAIIEGFAVGVGKETYVVPIDSVVECLDFDEAALEGDQKSRERGRGVINLRGEAIPYLRLRELFQINGEAPRRESLVVVEYPGGRAGLVADFLYGERQAVIKPLGKLFREVPWILGSTILGNGRVALILDVACFVNQAAVWKERGTRSDDRLKHSLLDS